MNKNRGLTAGAVVLTGVTGFLLRPFATSSGGNAGLVGKAAEASRAASLRSEAREEGPWIASCDYWAAVRTKADQSPERQRVSIKVDVDGSSFNSSATAAEADAVSCPGGQDRWGIPQEIQSSKRTAGRVPANTITRVEQNQPTPQITAIIATVPDPTREHLALDFDHTIDGLLQAANDNRYLESYSWLPWKSPGEVRTSIELSTEQDQLQQTERERKRLKEPGLIVLKYFDPSQGENYYKTLYLFLVGNTPMEGVEGEQFANALRYESELQRLNGVCFRASVVKDTDPCDPPPASGTTSQGRRTDKSLPKDEPANSFESSPNALTIIGPNFSAAAGSLQAQLQPQPGKLTELRPSGIRWVNVIADVGTDAALMTLRRPPLIHVVSFADSATYESNIVRARTCQGVDQVRTVVLVEDNSVYGAAVANRQSANSKQPTSDSADPCENYWQTIKYPRGISLLRNAHEEEPAHSGQENDATPSPYLHMSLADTSDLGTIPQFSPQTATSQEAQLVEITQRLQRSRAQLIILTGGNPLDTIFLARFFHRAFPDARLLEFGADLLATRDTENQPLVGAIAIDAYPLMSPVSSNRKPGAPRRPFASTFAESVYNAASFALWNEANNDKNGPELGNYRNALNPDPGSVLYPSLWAMAVGRNAFYPIGVLAACGSRDEQDLILPLLHTDSKMVEPCSKDSARESRVTPGSHRWSDIERIVFPKQTSRSSVPFSPNVWWYYLCGAVFVGCIVHTFCMLFASFSSLAMRDLAIDEMNDPCRRAVFIHIGSVMLFGMAFVVGFPIMPMPNLGIWNPTAEWFGRITILAGVLALVVSFRKAIPYVRRKDIPRGEHFPYRLTHVFLAVHAIAFISMIAIPGLWFWSCEEESNYVGLFFSFRALNPLSGVSPLLPVLLVLFGWYLWSMLQTRRLRFSEQTRPQIPGDLEDKSTSFYVSDNGLETSLYQNLTCLFITPHILCQLSKDRLKPWHIWTILIAIYGVLLWLCLFCIHPEGIERLLNNSGRIFPLTTAYEWLFGSLFFTLLLIALTGFLRMAVIWTSLRRQLLRRLEFFPIRFAFGRMTTAGWISMMRQSDLLERHREMARSLESMRQIAHHKRTRQLLGDDSEILENLYERALLRLNELRRPASKRTQSVPADPKACTNRLTNAFDSGQDFPKIGFDDKLRLMYNLENDFACFAEQLLQRVLIPYWKSGRVEIVESEEHETTHARRLTPGDTEAGPEYAIHAGLIKEPPLHICLAEEFVAIRYVSLIRAVLVNIRHLITFVSCAWVLSMIAWNSYPFRPRETVDVIFTVLFVTLGIGIVWVFSQMYRDVLLSRITRTEGNELGAEFYIRVGMFGAIPLLTWLAYQFPAVGAIVLKYLQPGIEAAK